MAAVPTFDGAKALPMQRIAITCFLLSPSLLLAQAGTLDLGFSNDGRYVTDVSAYADEVHAVLVQPDGMTVGAGWIDDGSLVLPFVQRLQEDGTPDPLFGTAGTVYFPVAGQSPYVYAIGMQSTGNLVLAGLIYDGSFDGNALLVRLLPDGSPDPSFGTDGLLSLDYGAGFGFQSAWAMQVMDDDRIILVGEEGENGIACLRLSAEGVPDASFGTNGLALTGIPFSSGLCVKVLDDGSVLAGGYRVEGDSDWMLARFDASGVLDPGFGVGGVVTMDVGGIDTEFMRGVDVLPDGRVAACGSRSFSGLDDEPAVALFSSTGDPDADFGTGGFLLLPYAAPQWGQARSLIAQPDNKLLIGGFRAQPGAAANNDFFLYRLLDDGSFDPSFDSGGQVHTDVSDSYDRSFAMALAPNGAIVVAGFGTGSDRASAYARYINDIGTGMTITVSTSSGLNVFPNPATERVRVSFAGDPASPWIIRLYALDGTLVLANRLVASGSGMEAYWLELPNTLRRGAYLLEVNVGNEVLRTKVLVARE